jgi:hypothetical protein
MQPAPAKSSARLRHPRRQYIINPSFQYRAMYPVLIFAFLFFALTLGIVWLPMHHQLARDSDPIIKAILAAQLMRIEIWLATLFVLSGSLAAIVALLRSHRVAGPMRRLRGALAKLAVGEPEHLVFRRKDEFRDLEAPFAGVVSRMDEMVRTRLEMLRFLRHNLEGLSARAQSERLSAAELKESVAVLIRDVDAEIKKLQKKS